MTMMFRFICYEEVNPTYPACLVAEHKATRRVAYFDSHDELTFDITSMAVSAFQTDEGQPLIGLALKSQPSRTTFYVPLDELANAIAQQQDDLLWRLLRMTTRTLPPQHRVA